MLYLIGLGLGDERDITVKGLEAIRSCARVFLDAYTSILGVDTAKLVSTTPPGGPDPRALSAHHWRGSIRRSCMAGR